MPRLGTARVVGRRPADLHQGGDSLRRRGRPGGTVRNEPAFRHVDLGRHSGRRGRGGAAPGDPALQPGPGRGLRGDRVGGPARRHPPGPARERRPARPGSGARGRRQGGCSSRRGAAHGDGAAPADRPRHPRRPRRCGHRPRRHRPAGRSGLPGALRRRAAAQRSIRGRLEQHGRRLRLRSVLLRLRVSVLHDTLRLLRLHALRRPLRGPFSRTTAIRTTAAPAAPSSNSAAAATPRRRAAPSRVWATRASASGLRSTTRLPRCPWAAGPAVRRRRARGAGAAPRTSDRGAAGAPREAATAGGRAARPAAVSGPAARRRAAAGGPPCPDARTGGSAWASGAAQLPGARTGTGASGERSSHAPHARSCWERVTRA